MNNAGLMLKKRHIVVTGLLVVQLMQMANATDLLTVYEQARIHDAQYQSALLRFKGDVLTRDLSRARYKPNLTFSYRAAHNDYESDHMDVSRLNVNDCTDLNCIVSRVNQLNRDGTHSAYESQQASLLLTQTIYDATFLADNKKASAFIEKSKEELLDAEKELMMRVAATYLKVLKAADEKKLCQSQLDALANIRNLAEKRYHLGVGKEREWYEAQASYDAQTVAYDLASVQYTMALQQLSDMSGNSVSSVSSVDEDIPVTALSDRTIEQWLEIARVNSNTLQAARAFEQVSYFDMQSKKNAGLPKFNFAVSYIDDELSGGQGFSPASNIMAYGIEMKWPIYQGGGVDASSRQAAYRLEESRERIRQLQQGIEAGTKGLLMAVASDVKRYESARHFLKSAIALEKVAQKAWQNGSGTFVEWFAAQKTLLQARQGVQQVRYDYIEHRISLQRMVGELSLKELEQVNSWLIASTAP